MKPTHWKCYRCRKMKKLGTEIKRADLYALCNECIQGRDTSPGASGEAAPQEAVVRVHHPFPRRHGRDRNEQS
jgi:hypothetical protein